MIAVVPFDNIYPERVPSWVSVSMYFCESSHLSSEPKCKYVDSILKLLIQTPITKHYTSRQLLAGSQQKLQICANSFAMFVL
jgi:hypothetical protein